jgi:hypothetical protein
MRDKSYYRESRVNPIRILMGIRQPPVQGSDAMECGHSPSKLKEVHCQCVTSGKN